MNFRQQDIDKFLKTPDLGIKCVVIFGTNEGMIADLTRQFAQTACPDLSDAFRVVYLENDDVEKDNGLLFGEYNAQSLIGGRRVVIVKNASNSLTAVLKTLFTDTKSDTLLVVNSTTINTKSSLVTLAKDNPAFALIACYDDRDESIFSTARAHFIQNGITVSPEAMQLLCARLSPDRKISANELEKLDTYLMGRLNLTVDDVQAAICDSSESDVEDLCYFVAGGNLPKALDSYQELLNAGTEPPTILRYLTSHFIRLLDMSAQIEAGQSARVVVDSQRPPVIFYRKDALTRQISIWKKNNINDVLTLLYKTERDCKTTIMPAEDVLGFALLQIGGAARKLAR